MDTSADGANIRV